MHYFKKPPNILQKAVDSVTSGGNTALYDAAVKGMLELGKLTQNYPDCKKYVGDDNDHTGVISPICDVQTNPLPD